MANHEEESIGHVLSKMDIHPVLIEVGAREVSAPIWTPIAPYACYVGVGPEAKADRMSFGKDFWRVHLIESALTDTEAQAVSMANICSDPVYSSVLNPISNIAMEYIDLDNAIAGQAKWPTCTLNSLVDSLGLRGPDWLHLNIGGVEARIYRSIKDEQRRRILALDTCLDLVDLYEDQDRTLEAYRMYLDEGFWLSRVSQHGPVRIGRESIQKLNRRDPSLTEQFFKSHHRRCPGWLFGRFLRTVDSLRKGDFSRREYVLLWSFAFADSQFGLAADVAFEYERAFGNDEISSSMLDETVRGLKGLQQPWTVRGVAKRVLPSKIRTKLRQILG